MATGRQRSHLSERSRRLIIAAAVAEGCLKIAALIDIKRRPASQIRGPKWLWAAVVVIVNSFGPYHSHTSPSGDGSRDPGAADSSERSGTIQVRDQGPHQPAGHGKADPKPAGSSRGWWLRRRSRLGEVRRRDGACTR